MIAEARAARVFSAVGADGTALRGRPRWRPSWGDAVGR